MPRGIFSSEDHTPQNKLADFWYAPNDALAKMIVNAWVDKGFRDLLLKDSDNAKTFFAAAGFYWHGTARKPVVITEKQYNDGYTSDDDEIVFVLPARWQVSAERIFSIQRSY